MLQVIPLHSGGQKALVLDRSSGVEAFLYIMWTVGIGSRLLLDILRAVAQGWGSLIFWGQ